METLRLAGGDHIFMNKHMLGKELALANKQELQVEKEYFKALCFILRADETLFNDLKSSVYRGIYEYVYCVISIHSNLIKLDITSPRYRLVYF